jgi:hypothetical protein
VRTAARLALLPLMLVCMAYGGVAHAAAAAVDDDDDDDASGFVPFQVAAPEVIQQGEAVEVGKGGKKGRKGKKGKKKGTAVASDEAEEESLAKKFDPRKIQQFFQNIRHQVEAKLIHGALQIGGA